VVLANPAEIVTVDARRGHCTGGQRLILTGHQATPRKGSVSCMSRRLRGVSGDEVLQCRRDLHIGVGCALGQCVGNVGSRIPRPR
jgi:hypothetical protein